jgi:hypothetical protein
MQMTDEQVMTLSVAIILPLTALIYSNSRISNTRTALEGKMNEMKETLRAEMKALRIDVESQIKTVSTGVDLQITTLRTEMQIGFAQISAEIKDLKTSLKVHELEHHK